MIMISNRIWHQVCRCGVQAKMSRRSVILCLLFSGVLLYVANIYNVYEYLMQRPFHEFQYPLEINMRKVVQQVLNNEYPEVQPINYQSYPSTFNNQGLCKTKSGDNDNVYLLFVVKSSLSHFEGRKSVRETWGNQTLIPNVKVRLLFLLGTNPSDPASQEQIKVEHAAYGDIQQDGYVDAYYNNTLKMMMGFGWVRTHCMNAEYVVFMDDDYYVNNLQLLRLLRSVEPYQRKDLMMGYLWSYPTPYRIKYSKWYISLDEYPYRFWPPFLTGGTLILTPETVQKLYIAMHYTQYLRFDDVFVGILAYKLGIRLTHVDQIIFKCVSMDTEEFSKVITMHGCGDHAGMKELWKKQQELAKKKGTYF